MLFVDITAFGRTAEVMNQYLKKGSKLLVEGRLKLDSWTDREGGKRSKHTVVIENMTMLGSKDDNHQRPVQQTGKGKRARDRTSRQRWQSERRCARDRHQ